MELVSQLGSALMTQPERKSDRNFYQISAQSDEKHFLWFADRSASTPNPATPPANIPSMLSAPVDLPEVYEPRVESWDLPNTYRLRSKSMRDAAACLYGNTLHEPITGSLTSIQDLVYEVPRRAGHYRGRRNRFDFRVAFDIADHLSQYPETTLASLGSRVVLIGSKSSPLDAKATTCEKYIREYWPETGPFFLEFMEKALDGSPFVLEHDRLNVSVDVDFSNYRDIQSIVLRVFADDVSSVVHVGQQLAFLGSALQLSKYKPDLSNISSRIQYSESHQEIHIIFEQSPIVDQSCWIPVFSEAVIVSGFPIPGRRTESGLEISLELLAGISGIQHAVEFEGGVVMKGFSHMFVPISKSCQSIQWHAITNSDPQERLTYRDGISRCKSRALLSEVSLDDLPVCRTFVGWCSIAKTQLGSIAADYENLDYSGAKDAQTGLRFTGGQLGFQQFGLAALNFKLGARDGKCHFQRTGPFRTIVNAAEKTPIVLLDTREKRSWLVPASEVLLHIMQHRHVLEPFEINDGLRTELGPADTAKDVLMRSAKTILECEENHTFKDAVLGYWSQLEFLLDHNISREMNASGAALNLHPRPVIKGFEFKAVVEKRSPFKLKEVELDRSSGGWPLLTKDIDALVLLADGFGDIIVPSDECKSNLCQKWQRLPLGKDYLATSSKMLQDLYNVAGCRTDRKYLTSSHLLWDKGTARLFETCPDPRSCRCDRVQQLLPPRGTFRTVTPPDDLAEEGAVIFGKVQRTLQRCSVAAPIDVPQNISIYRHPNDVFESNSEGFNKKNDSRLSVEIEIGIESTG